jgi:RimJ/RimL family protein N-acetyltransferase
MILEGKNVRMRPLTVEDAERTNRWRNSPRAFLLNRGARTIEEQAEWVRSRAKFEERGEEYNFIIEPTAFDTPVGMISLLEIHPVHLHAEVGHFLIGEPDLNGSCTASSSMNWDCAAIGGRWPRTTFR